MRIPLALFVVAIGTQAALGYDASALKVIGFSPDGRYFALEENGDNEGGHYTTTIVMDVAKSRSVSGSPFVGIEDNETLDKANARAAKMIETLGISKQPSLTVTVPEAKAQETADSTPVDKIREAAVKVLTLPDGFGPGARLTLTHSTRPSRKCDKGEDGAAVIRLRLEKKAAKPVQISGARNIPSPEDCLIGYGIAEAHVLHLPDGGSALAVIVQYFYNGFEGTDRRFMAVTARIPALRQ